MELEERLKGIIVTEDVIPNGFKLCVTAEYNPEEEIKFIRVLLPNNQLHLTGFVKGVFTDDHNGSPEYYKNNFRVVVDTNQPNRYRVYTNLDFSKEERVLPEGFRIYGTALLDELNRFNVEEDIDSSFKPKNPYLRKSLIMPTEVINFAAIGVKEEKHFLAFPIIEIKHIYEMYTDL